MFNFMKQSKESTSGLVMLLPAEQKLIDLIDNTRINLKELPRDDYTKVKLSALHDFVYDIGQGYELRICLQGAAGIYNNSGLVFMSQHQEVKEAVQRLFTRTDELRQEKVIKVIGSVINKEV